MNRTPDRWAGRCPVCGQLLGQCPTHSPYGDPDNHLAALAHSVDQHRYCHPAGCRLACEKPLSAAQRRARQAVTS